MKKKRNIEKKREFNYIGRSMKYALNQELNNQDQVEYQIQSEAQEIKELEKKLKEAEEKNKEEKEKFLRLLADYENRMKRTQIDAQNFSNKIISGLIKDLIPFIDDLYKASENAEKQIKEGIELIVKNVKKTLNKYGVEEIIPKIGDLLNVNYHQAISTTESSQEEGTIVEILKTGYKLNEQIVTPAIVITAA